MATKKKGIIEKVKDTFSAPTVETDKLKWIKSLLVTYRADKGEFDRRIIHNHDWYATRHYKFLSVSSDTTKNKKPGDIDSVSNYLFSTLSSKHADLMEFYPKSNFLPRSKAAADAARRATKSMPLIYDRAGFKDEYNTSLWTLLKSGNLFWASIYDENAYNGAEIQARKVDPLRIYFDWNQTNIQNSEAVCIWDELPQSTFTRRYPGVKGQTIKTGANMERYDNETAHTTSVIVWDAYYKDDLGHVQLIKWSGSETLYDSTEDEDHPEYAEFGYYTSGFYPVVHVQLFPEEQVPMGFGYVDILKSPQAYIDKLDEAFLTNIARSCKQRRVVSGSADDQFAKDLDDYSLDTIVYNGSAPPSDMVFPIQDRELSANSITYRDKKIQELKETSGTGEFARGEAGHGVTAASAIHALMQSSNKISRDATDAIYSGKQRLDRIIMGQIRQFYDEPREFRVPSDTTLSDIKGEAKLAGETNTPQMPEVPGEQVFDYIEISAEDMGIDDMFDIEVRPEKKGVFAQEATNIKAQEFFNLGMFNPERAEESLISFSMMEFEGKEDVMAKVTQNASMYQQLIEMQKLNVELSQDVQALSEMATNMNTAIKTATGADLLAEQGAEPRSLDLDQPQPE